MNTLILLALIFFLPLTLFIAWLILSTCMGDSIRARIAGVPLNVRHASYGKTYARNFGAAMNQGGVEQIEMENMMAADGFDGDEFGGFGDDEGLER